MKSNIGKIVGICVLLSSLAAGAAAQDRTILVAAYGAGGQDRTDVTSIVQSRVRNGALNFFVSSDVFGANPQQGAINDLSIVVREPSGRISEYRFRDGDAVNLQLASYSYSGGRLPDQAQRQFDGFYLRWLQYQDERNHESAEEMEERMREIMRNFNIPRGTPYDSIASPGVGASRPGWEALRIEQAIYGMPGKTLDVTARLQSMVRNNTIQLHVTNDNLGADPAPGQFKQLRVTYFYHGEERRAVVDEKDFLRIP